MSFTSFHFWRSGKGLLFRPLVVSLSFVAAVVLGVVYGIVSTDSALSESRNTDTEQKEATVPNEEMNDSIADTILDNEKSIKVKQPKVLRRERKEMSPDEMIDAAASVGIELIGKGDPRLQKHIETLMDLLVSKNDFRSIGFDVNPGNPFTRELKKRREHDSLGGLIITRMIDERTSTGCTLRVFQNGSEERKVQEIIGKVNQIKKRTDDQVLLLEWNERFPSDSGEHCALLCFGVCSGRGASNGREFVWMEARIVYKTTSFVFQTPPERSPEQRDQFVQLTRIVALRLMSNWDSEISPLAGVKEK